MADMPCSLDFGCCDTQKHPEKQGQVYSSVLRTAEGMNERCKGHMKMPSLEAEEVAAVRVLVVVVVDDAGRS